MALLNAGIKAQIARLTNTALLPDSVTLTRYEVGDGYTAPTVAGTASTAARISLKQTTLTMAGGLTRNFAGTITLPGTPLTWTIPPADDAEPEDPPLTFSAAAQVNDRLTLDGIEYRVDALGQPRLDGQVCNNIAYLAFGNEEA
jgi:hypothetical protein